MGGLDSLDWSSIKFEIQKMEAQLGEWFLEDEVKYLRGWAFAFAERKAEYAGISLNCPSYYHLQALTRLRVMKEFYEDFKQKLKNNSSGLVGLKCSLVSYQDIDRLVEEDIDRVTRPSSDSVPKDLSSRLYDVLAQDIKFMECTLSEYVSKDEIDLLRNASFNYAEDRAQKLNLVRGSSAYRRLHLAARYELLCEAEESLVGFCCESMDFSMRLVRDLAEHNDLDYVLKEYESCF